MKQKIRRDRNIGDNLRKLRLDHDISQKNFAQNFNVGVVILVVALMQNMKQANLI